MRIIRLLKDALYKVEDKGDYYICINDDIYKGQVWDKNDREELNKFCKRNKLVLYIIREDKIELVFFNY